MKLRHHGIKFRDGLEESDVPLDAGVDREALGFNGFVEEVEDCMERDATPK